MTKEKAERIIRIYNWMRIIVLIAFLSLIFVTLANAQVSNSPQVHGILRGKYEYEPEMEASRFEVRNARLAVNGDLGPFFG